MELNKGDIVTYRSSREYHKFLILDVKEPNCWGIAYRILDLETGKQKDFMFYPVDKYHVQKVE